MRGPCRLRGPRRNQPLAASVQPARTGETMQLPQRLRLLCQHAALLRMLLLPLPGAIVSAYTTEELAAMPRGGAPCAAGDPFACFGNGDCVSARCNCAAGWTGANCTTLDLAPGPPNGAIRRAGWSSWGGSPIRADDGKIHVFASQMANHCPLGTWQNNSLVIHAIADEILGPYTVQDELVLPPFHHNPSVQRAPDGTFLIYCIGAKAGDCPGGPDTNCSGATIKHCPPPDAETASPTAAAEAIGQTDGHRYADDSSNVLDGVVHLAHSKSLAGPWQLQPADTPVLAGRPGRWDAQSTNPAPHVLPNGTALLVYRGVNGLGTDRIGAAKAASWAGAYERVCELRTRLSPTCNTEMIVSPRQARDKHRKPQTKIVFLRW
jgi:hypothetical protein